jgi:hypothetical protein
VIPGGERRRKLHAPVFTAVFSRYCYVYLTFPQTTLAVIAGCEAAWEFFSGVFPVLIPDNLKQVVDAADRLEPRWNREWLEYVQARGIAVDPARVRSPQDRGRVESGVKFTHRSLFAGEQFPDIGDAQRQADGWCRDRAGMRVHGTTRLRPAEAFADRELPLLTAIPAAHGEAIGTYAARFLDTDLPWTKMRAVYASSASAGPTGTDRSGRPARLPGAPGDADGRDPQAARPDQPHQARRQPRPRDHRTRARRAPAAAAAPSPHDWRCPAIC